MFNAFFRRINDIVNIFGVLKTDGWDTSESHLLNIQYIFFWKVFFRINSQRKAKEIFHLNTYTSMQKQERPQLPGRFIFFAARFSQMC